MSQAIGPRLRKYWNFLSPLPGGKWLFTKIVGIMAPYSGTLGATVSQLRPGFGEVELRDRRRIHNHLNSVHAIALANLAELTTGLTLMNSLPDSTRGILVGIEMEYLKKARGQLRAACHCTTPPPGVNINIEVSTDIYNRQNEVVARGKALWRIGPLD
jgi:acyl-coenzyme A thioesterase PaaI-like protein